MAPVGWLLEICAIVVCAVAGIVVLSVLLCAGIASAAGDKIRKYEASKLGLFELNDLSETTFFKAGDPTHDDAASRSGKATGRPILGDIKSPPTPVPDRLGSGHGWSSLPG